MDGRSGPRPGDIILMHFRPGTARDVLRLLAWIRQAGLRPAAPVNHLPASLGGRVPGQARSGWSGPDASPENEPGQR